MCFCGIGNMDLVLQSYTEQNWYNVSCLQICFIHIWIIYSGVYATILHLYWVYDDYYIFKLSKVMIVYIKI